jgi:hypothetical protein
MVPGGIAMTQNLSTGPKSVVMFLKFHRFWARVEANSEGIIHEPGDDKVSSNR